MHSTWHHLETFGSCPFSILNFLEILWLVSQKNIFWSISFWGNFWFSLFKKNRGRKHIARRSWCPRKLLSTSLAKNKKKVFDREKNFRFLIFLKKKKFFKNHVFLDFFSTLWSTHMFIVFLIVRRILKNTFNRVFSIPYDFCSSTIFQSRRNFDDINF